MTRLHSAWRCPAAALLLLNAAVHVLLIRGHLEEAPYIGVLFILLSAACIALCAAVMIVDTAAIWATIGVVSVLALAAFLISRTVGLPQIGDDIGNWTEPLGYPAVAAEALSAVVATVVLSGSRRGSWRRGGHSADVQGAH